MKKELKLLTMIILMCTAFLSACGGGGGGGDDTSHYTVGGAVSGLSGTVVLQNNGGDDLTITADGTFAFATAIADGSEYAVTVAAQPASQTCSVANGTGTITGANVTNVVVTCLPNHGYLDVTFDADGIVTTDLGSYEYASAMAIQSDGKIVVAGYSTYGPDTRITLARYNSNGSLDATFDTDGIVTTDVSDHSSRANAISIQSDGKIVVTGVASGDFALARYNSNGSLDTTFDTDGIVTTDLSSDDTAYAIVIQSDGKIVVAGYSKNGLDTDITLVRYLQ